MKTKLHFSKRLLSLVLCFAMVLTGLPILSLMAFAAESNGYKGGAGTKVSDRDSSTKYTLSLGDNASTEYAGRIWADKSVYQNDVTFATYGGGETVIRLNENHNGEDFLIAYSTLATSQSISGQAQAPVDVVFIIDTSGSMTDAMGSGDSTRRIVNTVKALNDAIDAIMKLNAQSRVGVVAFADESAQLLPLGRYEKGTRDNGQNAVTDFFSLSNNNSTLHVHAVREGTSQTVTASRNVSGGTNIQRGVYHGMNLLATEQSSFADVNGSLLQRIPSVVLLSDGAPTYSSDSTSWWAPANNNDDGPGSSPYYGNGMKALMTAAFMKKAIDRNYGVTGTKMQTTMYTIGMGIKGLSNTESFYGYPYYTGEQDLAYITLNPKANWDLTNPMAQSVKNAWTTYITNNGTPGVQTNNNETYTFTHPTGTNAQYDIDTDANALKNLVDAYYDADNASAVTSVFREIVANIAIAAPQVPTEIKGSDPMTDGYITYTDPLGEYMEVKDVKAILYAGQTFTAKTVTQNGDTVTYTFAGAVHSPVYGDQEIKNILITVKTENGRQTLTVKIPASVIPLRVNEVALNADGSVKTHTNNGAMPARVIYSVGLQSQVTKVADDGTVYIDRTKLSDAYLSANTNADGSVNFLSNEYTNPHLINGSTVGDATVEFEPSHSNGFYYILEDMPIYKDAAFGQQVLATEGLDDDTVYYYRDKYYHGNTVEVTPIERTGAQLKRTEIKTGTDGYLYRAAGSPRLNRILKFEGTKEQNATNTAQDFYAPEFHYADGSTSAYDGKFIVHLGNNGRLTVITGGNLQIQKTASAAPGLTVPDKTFEFTLDLNGTQVSNGSYEYAVTDTQNNLVSQGTVSAANPKIYLKHGQTATVFSLPPQTTYTVTETAENGFTTQAQGATGTIAAGETSVASFVNTYGVTPVSYPSQGTLQGQKVLVGRPWSSNDSFTFFLSPYNNAPLPDNYDPDAGVTVTGTDGANSSVASFDFGNIEFTAPGVYRYTIAEKEPENNQYLPGMSYSRALYRLVVTVVDNQNGTLSVQSSDLQKLYDDNANALFSYNNGQITLNDPAQDTLVFTNTYSAGDVVRVPVALKEYTDHSGQNPLVSGMFRFELKALGVVENNALVPNSVSSVPMPDGSVNGVITTNEGHNVTFPGVTFRHSHIPTGANQVIFRYQMREVIPANPANGMSYDNNVYTIDVLVSLDPNSSVLNVSPVYPNQQRTITFRNEYTPVPVSADIAGSKTLNGRDMKNGESFTFTLSAADAATNLAVRNGLVVIPSDTASVTNAQNAVAAPFAFEDLLFCQAGTYRFTVSETPGTAPGVTYDTARITVTVVIDDTDKDGNLEVSSVSYDNGKSAAEFTNTYTSRFQGTPVRLEGTKTLTGKTLLSGEFYFDIKEYYNGSLVNDRFVTHSADSTPDQNGSYTGNILFLDNVSYDKAGTYEYLICEQIPVTPVSGTTYDQSKFRFTVVVEDDGNGNLAVTSTALQKENGSAWESANAVAFSNTYVPTPATDSVPLIYKVVEGDRAQGLQENEFAFELKLLSAEHADGIILPTVTTVKNDADGKVLFDPITFTKAGTYTVSVSEIVPDDADKVAGITYSQQVITAVFTVYDNRIGDLTATLTQLTGGESIINRYQAEPAQVTLDITKTFTGRENDQWLPTDKFDFEVKVTDADTLLALANGRIEFALDAGSTDTKTLSLASPSDSAAAAVKVNAPGTYRFRVREIHGGIPGVIYDSSEKDVVIVATDDSVNAKIQVKVNEQDTDRITLPFANRYAPDAVTVVLGANGELSKTLQGRKLLAEEFEFVLLDSEKNPVVTAKNTQGGTFSFSLSFDKAGTYRYTLAEKDNGVPGVSYDKTVYGVEIVIVDTNEQLEVDQVIYSRDTAPVTSVVFQNTYEPETTDLILQALKTLRGRDLTDGEFTFVLKDNDGKVVATATNAKDGTIVFDKIVLTKAGVYTYTVFEATGTAQYVTYDKTEYVVEITVTDDGKGKLVASEPVIQKAGSNETVARIEFENVYEVPTLPQAPVTGDDPTMGLWIALFVLSTAGLFGTAWSGKKKKAK